MEISRLKYQTSIHEFSIKIVKTSAFRRIRILPVTYIPKGFISTRPKNVCKHSKIGLDCRKFP